MAGAVRKAHAAWEVSLYGVYSQQEMQMQIRERKTTWALIRTRYDKTRKRGVSQCLGTVSKSVDHLPETLSALLSVPERQQIEALIWKARVQRETARRQHYARLLPVAIDLTTEWYLDPRNVGSHSASHANDMRDAFSRLLSAMVKAGVGRKRKRTTTNGKLAIARPRGAVAARR